MRFRGVIILGLAFVGTILWSGVGTTDDFSKAVLRRLTREQILAYLNGVDAGRPPHELGAKYLWGAVPLDREAPAYLGDWWRRLAPAEREEKQVAWFRVHFGELDLDEVKRYVQLEPLVDEVKVGFNPRTGERVRPWWVREAGNEAEADTVPAAATVSDTRGATPPAPVAARPAATTATTARPAATTGTTRPAAAATARPATPAAAPAAREEAVGPSLPEQIAARDELIPLERNRFLPITLDNQ